MDIKFTTCSTWTLRDHAERKRHHSSQIQHQKYILDMQIFTCEVLLKKRKDNLSIFNPALSHTLVSMLGQSHIKILVSDLVLCVWCSVKMSKKKNLQEDIFMTFNPCMSSAENPRKRKTETDH